MSMKIEAGEYKKGDLFFLFPQDIVVDPSRNARSVPHTPEQVQSLADSILADRQQQPAVGRRIDGNRVQLVAGYGRWAAVHHINTVIQPESPVRLSVIIRDMNEEEAFIASLDENLERAETTPVDDAHAQRILRETYLWEEERIAQKYKRSVSYLGNLREVLKLSKPLQAEVANGHLPVAGAVALAKLPEAERQPTAEAARDPETQRIDTEAVQLVAKLPAATRAEIVQEAQADGKPIDTQAVREEVRSNPKTTGKKVLKRRMPELVKLLEGLTGPGENKATKGLASALLAFIAGKIPVTEMEEIFRD